VIDAVGDAEQDRDIGALSGQFVVEALSEDILCGRIVSAEHAPVSRHDGVAEGDDARAVRIWQCRRVNSRRNVAARGDEGPDIAPGFDIEDPGTREAKATIVFRHIEVGNYSGLADQVLPCAGVEDVPPRNDGRDIRGGQILTEKRQVYDITGCTNP